MVVYAVSHYRLKPHRRLAPVAPELKDQFPLVEKDVGLKLHIGSHLQLQQ